MLEARINSAGAAPVLLMFAIAYGIVIGGSVLDRVDLVVAGFVSLCVPTLILLGCNDRRI